MDDQTNPTLKALTVITLLNAAVKNVRLYPPASDSVVQSIDRLYHAISNFLADADEERLLLAESEKTFLIGDQPLKPADQEKSYVLSILNLLISYELKSISFERGLLREELSDFLNFFSHKPESIKNEGGLAQMTARSNITHITLDEKVFVAVSKDHQLAATLDISDKQIVHFIMQALPEMDPASAEFQEMARKPEILARAFDTTIARILSQKDKLSELELTQSLAHMLSLLDKTAAGMDSENINSLAQSAGHSLAGAVPEITKYLTAQNMAHLLGGFLLQFLMAELASGAGGEGDQEGAGGGSAETIRAKLLDVADKFSLHLQNEKMLLDEGLMSALPQIITQLIAHKEQEAMEALLERLADNLASEKSEVRLSAARGLADIMENLPVGQKHEIVEKLSRRLIAWLINENIYSPDYNRICLVLKDETHRLIGLKSLPEAQVYLDTFQAIVSSVDDKPDEIKNSALESIRQLISPENIAILQSEMDPEDLDKQDEAGRVFVSLGRDAVLYLLEKLRTSTDSDDRVSAMHLITYAKEEALPLINVLITRDAPWYYLRNLAYLLGRMGDEDSAESIAPLLSSSNQKLRMEALKSIYKIGGNLRGKILLDALPEADDEFKSAIIEVLGQAKIVEAIPVMINILRQRPLIATASRTVLEEKICMALGAIGDPRAIRTLEKIAEPKSFLRRRTFPDKVKAAAARSLVSLREKLATTDES